MLMKNAELKDSHLCVRDATRTRKRPMRASSRLGYS